MTIRLGARWQKSRGMCHCRQVVSRLAFTRQLHGSGGSRDPTARRTTMFDTASASNGVKLALLEGQLLTREIDRATFVEHAANLAPPAPAIRRALDKFRPIAANQTPRPPKPRPHYDHTG